jgi:hypothetical protein
MWTPQVRFLNKVAKSSIFRNTGFILAFLKYCTMLTIKIWIILKWDMPSTDCKLSNGWAVRSVKFPATVFCVVLQLCGAHNDLEVQAPSVFSLETFQHSEGPHRALPSRWSQYISHHSLCLPNKSSYNCPFMRWRARKSTSLTLVFLVNCLSCIEYSIS